MKDYKLKIQSATARSEKSPLHAASKGIDNKKTADTKGPEANYFATKDVKGSLPWFQVELKEESVVWKVMITNRLDIVQTARLHITVGNSKRTDDYIVNERAEISQNRNKETFTNASVVTSKNNECSQITGTGKKGEVYLINCVSTNGSWPRGKYVTLQEISEDNSQLTFRELEVFGTSNIFIKLTIYF